MEPIKIQHVIDEQNNLEYQHFIDDKDRHHLSGQAGKDRYGSWVSNPGLRIVIKDGDLDVISKEEWNMSNTDEPHVHPTDVNEPPKPSVEYPYKK